MILVEPYGGLCNRIRVIASAISLCREYNKKLTVIWKNNRELGCSFSDLFKPIEGITILEVNPSNILNYISYHLVKRKSDYHINQEDSKKMYLNNNYNIIDTYDVIYIKTCHKFFDYNYLSEFVPVNEIAKEVEKYIEFYDDNTVGVHIRRTDNVNSTQVSKTEMFIQCLDNEIMSNSNVKFYLATDSKKEEEKLKKIYKGRIIAHNKKLSRNSVKGMKDSVVDLLCLAHTKKIYGSYWSSFSEVAAEFKNIERITVGLIDNNE